MRTSTVSIDGESASDSASTDRSNMVYGIGGEFSFDQRFGVRLGWDRYAEVGSDDLAGEVDYRPDLARPALQLRLSAVRRLKSTDGPPRAGRFVLGVPIDRSDAIGPSIGARQGAIRRTEDPIDEHVSANPCNLLRLRCRPSVPRRPPMP